MRRHSFASQGEKPQKKSNLDLELLAPRISVVLAAQSFFIPSFFFNGSPSLLTLQPEQAKQVPKPHLLISFNPKRTGNRKKAK